MGYPARKMIFQSTLPRGERHLGVRMVPGNRRISIHAPTGGSDDSEILLYDQIVNFNPRSHEGSDERKIRYRYRMDDFNPRSHEGSDDSEILLYDQIVNFNPRSHEGSDERKIRYRYRMDDFNPRSHEGSDTGLSPVYDNIVISTHAPTRGATQVYHLFMTILLFQPTLPRGERPELGGWIVNSTQISTHAPTRGATI